LKHRSITEAIEASSFIEASFLIKSLPLYSISSNESGETVVAISLKFSLTPFRLYQACRPQNISGNNVPRKDGDSGIFVLQHSNAPTLVDTFPDAMRAATVLGASYFPAVLKASQEKE
jgi:hypothetical protein